MEIVSGVILAIYAIAYINVIGCFLLNLNEELAADKAMKKYEKSLRSR